MYNKISSYTFIHINMLLLNSKYHAKTRHAFNKKKKHKNITNINHASYILELNKKKFKNILIKI